MPRLAVIDLDGTYLKANSLHLYMRVGLMSMLRRMRIFGAVKLTTIALARALHVISHVTMKFASARIIGWDPQLSLLLTSAASRHVNPDVTSLIERWQHEGCDIIIATASFDYIASAIVPYQVIGTALEGNTARAECRGHAKAERVAAYASTKGAALHGAITDNADDTALLKMPFAEKYLITPKGILPIDKTR